MCSDEEGMSDEVRRAFVDKHNEYRSLVAKGEAVNGRIFGFAPKAARMFKMKYDCNIEKSMMAWAKKCIWGHSPPLERQGLGENIWMISVPNYNKTASAIRATSSWFSELERYGIPVDNVLTVNVYNRGVGHYTQVVWQRSDRIGCAVKSCLRTTFAGCQYREPGNWINEKIYETGNIRAQQFVKLNSKKRTKKPFRIDEAEIQHLMKEKITRLAEVN
ncbi:C-type single domain activation associated secreted protein ASP3 [Trichostrongylus colubriformis]|uniref:C-type single domain activation associated secreted protein ASP3 n=1 Tax=Trichostrongylus colubriformis TaxID=6319 RepID=A0AAN8EWS5_TRICO